MSNWEDSLSLTSNNIRGDGQTQSYSSSLVVEHLLKIVIGFYRNRDSCDPLSKTVTIALDAAAPIIKTVFSLAPGKNSTS